MLLAEEIFEKAEQEDRKVLHLHMCTWNLEATEGQSSKAQTQPSACHSASFINGTQPASVGQELAYRTGNVIYDGRCSQLNRHKRQAALYN